MTRTVGVVIPAYRPNVALLSDYVRALQARLDPDLVRIELDAAGPETVEAVSQLPVEVNVAAARRGKGTAITAGFEALDTDVLVFVDADGSTPAESVADVLAPVLDGDADLSVGSRRHPDATIASHQTFARRRLGDGFAWLARQLLDAKLYDYQCGAKAMTRETWQSVRGHLYEPGFAWDIELVAVAAALGARLAEVPVVWEDQPGSTVSPVRTSLRLARGLLTSRHRAKLLADDSLHHLLEAKRDGPPSLLDRLAAEARDE
ncbi:Glycosyl transferase family 2 [Halogranum gelatinilyticum]|uniref:Glycosyl transferase family 2 n=1 Tax=Halogranum gelatinilyticum TaxID=660521 RepID=A0A1G9QJW1_9EURY|nr:glycosyltransferase [Halogranum gelatinilyticum]SDM11190.1 Glycosyl transferase family 2 [Halogranum gelatinilyticum]